MSNKFVYQNAQIKSRESKLLTLQGVQRLFDAKNPKEAMKVLIELGFGNGFTTDDEDFDALFAQEENNLCALLKEMNVAGALDAFLLENDYVNLKIATKAFCVKTEPTFLPDGLYAADNIVDVLNGAEVVGFDKHFANAIKGASTLVGQEDVTPRQIDTYIDKKAYEHIFAIVAKSGKATKEYFEKKADFANIGTFARVKKLGLDFEFFKSCYIEGGKIALSTYENAETLDDLAATFKKTEYEKLTANLATNKNVVAYEVECENILLKAWKDESFDMFSVAPIASYYFTKKTELKVAKLIVAGIKNHVAPQIIKERMRELYA